MNNKIVKTKQSILTWLLILAVDFALVGLIIVCHLGRLIDLIGLLFFGLGGIVLIIGFIEYMVNQPGITIDFSQRTITLNTIVIFRKKKSVTLSFNKIKNIKVKSTYMIQEYFVETKDDILNSDAKLKSLYGYLNKPNLLATSSMYITNKSRKQVNAAIEKLNQELD